MEKNIHTLLAQKAALIDQINSLWQEIHFVTLLESEEEFKEDCLKLEEEGFVIWEEDYEGRTYACYRPEMSSEEFDRWINSLIYPD